MIRSVQSSCKLGTHGAFHSPEPHAPPPWPELSLRICDCAGGMAGPRDDRAQASHRSDAAEESADPPATKRRRRMSSGASLLEVVTLGGGSAADLGQALLEAAPTDREATVLAAALKAAKRHEGDCNARRRSTELLSVVQLSGGTPAALIDALVEHGGGARDLQLVAAAAAAGGPAASAPAADTSDAPRLETGQAAPARSAGAAPGATAARGCTVCCAAPCAAGRRKTCAACCALVERLKTKTGGACKRAHVRAAYAELGSGAEVRAVKRRARQLAAGAPPLPAAEEQAEVAAAGHAEVPRPAATAPHRRSTHATCTRDSRGGAPAITASASAQDAQAVGVATPPRAACSLEATSLQTATTSGNARRADASPPHGPPLKDKGCGCKPASRGMPGGSVPAVPGSAAASVCAFAALQVANKAEGVAAEAQPGCGRGTPTAAATALGEVKMCAICRRRPRNPTYCGPCSYLSRNMPGPTNKAGQVRAAYKVLGGDASHGAVLRHVRSLQEAAAE